MPLRTLAGTHGGPAHGRGATGNPEGRYERWAREREDDGWHADPDRDRVPTRVTEERVKSIVSRNDSPDVPFDQSINPYRGCEHGCVYCYARPSHAWLGLSPGLDFETRLFAKTNAADVLRAELVRPGYRCRVISIGANTDPYQPVEKRLRITRSILELLIECRHPFGIVTKNAMVERDIDLLAAAARDGLTEVFVSVNSLDHGLARDLEPRCSAPARRLEAIRRLADAGIPVGVLVAPVIPFLNDHEVEAVLEAARRAGALRAGYVLLRLPHEVEPLFEDWLRQRRPLKAEHVMSRVRAMREGRANDPAFGSRMKGSGPFAALLARRFRVAAARCGYDLADRHRTLTAAKFRPPGAGAQLELF